MGGVCNHEKARVAMDDDEQETLIVPQYTPSEVAKHNSNADCWVIVQGQVVDVSAFLGRHPGGAQALAKEGRAGCDVSSHFVRIGHSKEAHAILASMVIGKCAVEGQDEEGGAHTEATLEMDGGKDFAVAWHGDRRRRILAAHPKIQQLYGYNLGTLFLGLFACFLHLYVAVLVKAGLPAASSFEVFIAAYTIGAWCKMTQFWSGLSVCKLNVMLQAAVCNPVFPPFFSSSVGTHSVAHELSHDNVFPSCLRRVSIPILSGSKPVNLSRWLNQAFLHVLTLPSLGFTVYEYYAYMHRGHHATLGAR